MKILKLVLMAIVIHAAILLSVWFVMGGSVSLDIMDWDPAARFFYLGFQIIGLSITWLHPDS